MSEVVTCLGEMRDRGLVAENGIHPAVFTVSVAEAVCEASGGAAGFGGRGVC